MPSVSTAVGCGQGWRPGPGNVGLCKPQVCCPLRAPPPTALPEPLGVRSQLINRKRKTQNATLQDGTGARLSQKCPRRDSSSSKVGLCVGPRCLRPGGVGWAPRGAPRPPRAIWGKSSGRLLASGLILSWVGPSGDRLVGGGGLRGGDVAVLLLSFIHRELRWEGDRTGQAVGSPEAGGPGGHHRQRPLDKTAAGPALPGRFCGAASVSLDLMVSLCPGRLCRCPVGPSAQPRRSALVYVGTTEDIPRSVLEGRFRQELSCLGPLCLPWGSSLCVTRRESLGPGPLLGTLSFVHLPLPPHALLSLLSWPCPARGQKPRSLLRGGRRCPC